MAIELTVAEVVVANKAIEDIKDISLPSLASFRLDRFQSKFQPIVKSFNDAREKLIKEKYGVENEEKNFEVPKDKMEDFYKELNTLLDSKEYVEIIPINICDFGEVSLPKVFFSSTRKIVVE